MQWKRGKSNATCVVSHGEANREYSLYGSEYFAGRDLTFVHLCKATHHCHQRDTANCVFIGCWKFLLCFQSWMNTLHRTVQRLADNVCLMSFTHARTIMHTANTLEFYDSSSLISNCCRLPYANRRVPELTFWAEINSGHCICTLNDFRWSSVESGFRIC